MGFAKGNDLWKEGIKVRNEQRDKMDEFFLDIANGGIDEYAKKMRKLADGTALEKSEEQYMEKVEKWANFVKPMRAREDGKGNADTGNKIIVVSDDKAKEIDGLLKDL